MIFTAVKSRNSLHSENDMKNTKTKEILGQAVFFAMATVCVIGVIAIFAFLFIESVPAFQKIGFFEFIFGKEWSPDRLDGYDSAVLSGSYGIFKMIVGTLAATTGALLIGGTLGYFTAVFLAFYCPKKLKKIFSFMINLLAGIPSVVYGFFGIVFLLPLLSIIAPNNGIGLLAASLILGIMILPTVTSLSKTSLEAVPFSYYEGALALGATHSAAVFGAMTKAARSGITASLVLGTGRAIGETMAVVMVAGNSVAYPKALFGSFRVLTANIIMEMGYAGELQLGALIATGVVLLIFTLLVNIIFGFILQNSAKKSTAQKHLCLFKSHTKQARHFSKTKDFISRIKYNSKIPKIYATFSISSGAFVGTVLLLIIGFIFVKGTPYLVTNPHLIFGKYEFDSKQITVLPSIITTLMTVALSILISVPIGLCTSIFLNEYAKKGNIFIKIIRRAIDILSGVPSIVYGLFGMLAFVKLLGGTCSILAGCLTVSIMLLPTLVRSSEESLKAVQSTLREGSLALGAGKLRTIFKIVLPSALPGILSAVILSTGRVISESAPFIYTMGSVISAVPTSYFSSNATLSVALYRLSGEGWYVNEAYATAVILIILVLSLNLFAELIASKLGKKSKGETH